MNRLAVIDWGIGGLGFYRSWKQQHPDDAVIYFSDSGFRPSSKISAERLVDRLPIVFDYLTSRHNVTHVMVACNAASSVLGEIHRDTPKVIAGVIDGTIEYINKNLSDKNVTLLGGIRTIESRIFSSQLDHLYLSEKVAQPLSAIVERGNIDGYQAKYAIQEIFNTVSDHVVLACTHYAALIKTINAIYPKITCHDPIPYIVEQKLAEWREFQPGESHFITTGDKTQSAFSTKKAFGLDVQFYSLKL